jgi:hypothetical protein
VLHEVVDTADPEQDAQVGEQGVAAVQNPNLKWLIVNYLLVVAIFGGFGGMDRDRREFC